MQAKWDGKYYLETSGKEQYKLGEQVVAYQTNTSALDLYGKMYQIQMDGSVQKLVGDNKIADFKQDNIYKLADRKYLITSSKITNDTGKLNTKNYLLIILDKAGNTLLLNNEVNAKTIKPMLIKTPSFEFDIANEKIIYEEKEIDLKKIIGSTNEYQQIELQEEEQIENQEKNTIDEQTQMHSQMQAQQQTQTQINNNSQTTTQTQINGSIISRRRYKFK